METTTIKKQGSIASNKHADIKNIWESAQRINKILFFLVLSHFTTIAQDIRFSQWYNAPHNINPALAGATKDIHIASNYIDQWQSPTAPYKFGGFSTDVRYVKKKWKKCFIGIGVNVFSIKNKNGIETTQGNLTIAYHVYTGIKSTLGAAMQGGFAQSKGNIISLSPKEAYTDFSGGLCWIYGTGKKSDFDNIIHSASLGIAMFHFNHPDMFDEALYLKIISHARAEIGIGKSKFSLIPGILYSKQGPAEEAIAGLTAKYYLLEKAAISLGSHYINKVGFGILSEVEIKNVALGISYNINTPSLNTGKGNFEISLRYGAPNNYN